MTGRVPARRVLGCVTLGYGTVLGLAGTRIAAGTGVARPIVRILAARYVAQGMVVLAGGQQWTRLAAVADATHALSMLPMLLRRRYRMAALASACVAVGLASASWWAA